MLFVRYENWRQYLRYYPVTVAILAINLILFAAMEWYGSSTDYETLLRFGAMFGLPGGALQPEWWRYVTSVFLHIGGTHLLFNGFALFVFAPPLERLLGPIRYILFYLAAGAGGNLVSHWLHSDQYISAGASGAIYGIYAAYMYLVLFRPFVLDQQSKQTIVAIVAIGLIYSLFPGVNLLAHLGGFLTGFALMALLAAWYRRK
jgi:rhomboid protease GluP